MAVAKGMEDEMYLEQYGTDFQQLDWYQQQYMNKWITTGKRLVYHYGNKNFLGHIECTMPKPPAVFFDKGNGCVFGLGMDFGFSPDPMAFVVVAYNVRCSNQLYVVYEHKQNEMYIPDINAFIKVLDRKYHFSFMVADAGAQAKAQVADLNNNYGWSIEPADKMGKVAHINTFNGDLRAGNILVDSSCSQLKDEWANLIWDIVKLNTQNKREEKSGLSNDLCLVAGTMIQTSDGLCKIDDIYPGQLVLTRQGYQAVLASHLTGIEPIWELTTQAGRKLRGTGGHKIILANGRIPIQSLKPGDILEVCTTTTESQSHSFTTELPTDATQTLKSDAIESIGAASISTEQRSDTYIAQSGLKSMEQYLMDITSTIWTTIRSTMISPIYNSFLLPTTCVSMVKSDGRTQAIERKDWRNSQASMTLPKNGMPHQKEANGTHNMPKMLGQLKKQIKSMFAKYASEASQPELTEPMSAQTIASPNKGETAALTMRQEPAQFVAKSSPSTNIVRQSDAVASVSSIGISLPVYNLTVANHHEYYANGILVANCDATLYAHFYCRHNWYKTPKPKYIPTMMEVSCDLAKELIGRNKPKAAIKGGYLPAMFPDISGKAFAQAGHKPGRK